MAQLCKVRVTLTVLLSTITGYVLYLGEFTSSAILPSLGLFALASGSAALNQYQEKGIDALMGRTQGRPIPMGYITSGTALVISAFLILSGTYLLFLGSGWMTSALGVFTLIWYNLFYTYLKRKTAFAVVPGSLTGAVPPVIGWVAAGGDLLDVQIIIVAFFLFIWQIPHFWLLLIRYGKEYEMAGLPSVTNKFTFNQLKRITFSWIVAVSCSALFFPLFAIVHSIAVICLIILLVIALVIAFYIIMFKKKAFSFKNLFVQINLFLILILTLLIIEKVIVS